ncbi:MAG TPA: hypothetical protein VFP17_10090 [Solirubrobacterales bacterium]|nr:hypothetical protein [Solirubrobacterales bacterium]
MSFFAQPRRAALAIACVVAFIQGGSLASADAAEFEEFGIKSASAQLTDTSAASHPDFVTRFELNHHAGSGGTQISTGRLESASVFLPPGLVGNPKALDQCSTGEFLQVNSSGGAIGNCPVQSQVGVVKFLLSGNEENESFTEPLYNLEPPHPDTEVARLGFSAAIGPVFIDISVRTGGDYGLTATAHGVPAVSSLIWAQTTIWGDPSDPRHNTQRLTTAEANYCYETGTACQTENGERSVAPAEKAFLTNPSACQDQAVDFAVTSFQLPGQLFTAQAPLDTIADCQGLPFEPTLELQPTTPKAGAPTGLHATIHLPQHEGTHERGTSTMREARVILPEGMTISASAAQGLEACSDEQVGFHQEVDAACPDASKLGTATIVSPVLEQPLHGAIYQRTPSPGHQFGLWLVTDELGLHVKLPGEVTGDPNTGQLTARFSGLPQLPVEEVALDLWGGPKAPLKNPDTCGSHTAYFDFTPWSTDPDATGQAAVTIDEGCGAGFSPKLTAGVTHPVAGAFSPFVLTLTRGDAEDNIKGLDVILPQGLLAKLRGVPLCPGAAAASGACPEGSKIGSVVVAAGAGPDPLWIPQPGKAKPQVYLAGPYAGAPYSIVSVVPAQAGPFDLGTVAVRSGLYVDPETGVATVRTTLPQVLEGATILYRTIHVVIDRRRFIINPTDCRAMKVKATVVATRGATAAPSDRFQVGRCRRLKFAPKLSLSLSGGSKRGEYPALTATMKTRRGDANVDHLSVVLPHSEFLAQEHIGTICTRKRFVVRNCPKRSVYGYAEAWTPLLSKALKGPVYLRSSDHPLPDLVAALRGQIEVDLDGRIDSTKGGGIRTTFATVPDAPVTKFVLRMNGGDKSLLVNSTDICKVSHRAILRIVAQNGRRFSSRPDLKTRCKKR